MVSESSRVPEKKATRVISAGIIVFRKTSEGIKYLILYHGRGYWNFPKGKLEYAKSAPPPSGSGNTNAHTQMRETSFQAALREVREETGLKSTELKFVGNFKAYEKFFFRRGSEKIFKIVILYLAETRQHKITISDEHEGFGWFKFSEAKKLLLRYKDSTAILQRAHDYLERRTADRTRINPLIKR